MVAKSVTFSIEGINPLKNLLLRLAESGITSRLLMAEIGTFLVTNIKLRTAKGIDASGRSFEPYTPKYKFFRQKKGLQTEKVDLFFTGSMISSMTYKATDKVASVYFLNTSDKSGAKNPNKAAWLNEKREFFALSNSDIDEIEEIVDDFIRRNLV